VLFREIPGLIRYLRADGNPLRRRVDRVHSHIVVALIASFLVAGPAVAAMAGSAVHGAGLRSEHREAGTRHQADVTVLGSAPGTSGHGPARTTPVRWRDAAGVSRLGVVPRSSTDRPGAHRRIWLDAAGEPTVHPRTHALTVTDTVFAALGSLALVGLLLAAVHSVADRRLDRERLAAWERDWTTVASQWTGRP
jgi:hypothetical protein